MHILTYFVYFCTFVRLSNFFPWIFAPFFDIFFWKLHGWTMHSSAGLCKSIQHWQSHGNLDCLTKSQIFWKIRFLYLELLNYFTNFMVLKLVLHSWVKTCAGLCECRMVEGSSNPAWVFMPSQFIWDCMIWSKISF